MADETTPTIQINNSTVVITTTNEVPKEDYLADMQNHLADMQARKDNIQAQLDSVNAEIDRTNTLITQLQAPIS